MDDEFIKQVSRKAKIILASAGISAALLTGSGSNNKSYIKEKVQIENIDYSNIPDDKVIYIPEDCKESIIDELRIIDKSYANKTIKDNIDFGDLKKLNKSLYLNINSSNDLSFLNYCVNVSTLNIIFYDQATLDDLKYITEIPNLQNLTIGNGVTTGATYINMRNGQFILNSNHLRALNVVDCGIDPAIINQLTNLEDLGINSFCHPEDIDFKQLKKLFHLSLNDGLYNAAIYFDDKMISTLKNDKIVYELSDNDGHSIDDLLDINKQLDNIVANLPINDKSTDQEKLNAILYYVLNNYNYDPDALEADKNNQNIDYNKFYNDGYLYGALTSKNIICGNYSAIMQALLIRAGVKTHLLISPSHAWNMVIVNGSYYYVDATLLDEEVKIEQHVVVESRKNGFPNTFKMKTTKEDAATALKNGDIYNEYDFPSYMMNPDDSNHISMNKPSAEALTIDNAPDSSPIENITNKIYHLWFNGTIYAILGGTLVGILVPLGIGKATGIIGKKEEKEEHNKKL